MTATLNDPTADEAAHDFVEDVFEEVLDMLCAGVWQHGPEKIWEHFADNFVAGYSEGDLYKRYLKAREVALAAQIQAAE